MTCFRKLSIFLVVFLLSLTFVNANFVYNQNGDFSVSMEHKSKTVFNDDIDTSFTFTVRNNLNTVQDFEIVLRDQSGWNIDLTERSLRLDPGQTREIKIDFEANSDFDYNPVVVSPDTVIISQNEGYVGYFEFPLLVKGEAQEVSVRLSVGINNREVLPVVFNPRVSAVDISPIVPLRYSITAENIEADTKVQVRVVLDDIVLSDFEETFTQTLNYKIYDSSVPLTVDPGRYDARVTIRKTQEGSRSAQEWFDVASVHVREYNNLVVSEESKDDFFINSYTINIENRGNVKSTFEKEIPVNFFSGMFFSSNGNFVKQDGKVMFSEELDRAESKTIVYSFNYIPLYLLVLFVLILSVYIYIRKASNPLNVEPKVYEVKKVAHEGVKSMKIKIGFENYKAEEIDNLKVVFRMPSYLRVKDDSFSMSPPKNVLKGREQYKLIWEFKRFEKLDSRILGFTLVNDRGILGDIKLPAIEFEVKIKGKVKKYYTNMPIIRG